MNKQFFKQIEDFLIRQVTPIISELDHDSQALQAIFNDFKALGIMKFAVPESYYGFGAERLDFVHYNILLSQYSSALLFLQIQHQYAVSNLNTYPTIAAIKKLYQQVVDNDKGVGVYLGRKEHLSIVENNNGNIRISGYLPWVSGYEFLDFVLTTVADKENIYYVLIPFKNIKIDDGEIICSEVIETIVVSSINTVQMTIKDWLIHAEDILYIKPLSYEYVPMPHSSLYNFAGASKALLQEVQKSSYFSKPWVQERYQQLDQALAEYIEMLLAPIDDPLLLRARGLTLARNCSLFAQLCVAGRALLRNSRVQHLVNDIWLYSVAGLREEVLQGYLKNMDFTVSQK